jgi:hypothetical protein
MYVDESGDIGMSNSPTKYFVLSAIVIHELRWSQALDELILFRKRLRDKTGLKLREEIHSSAFLNNPGDLIRIKMNDRVDILKQCIKWLNNQEYINIFSVCIDKERNIVRTKEEIFETSWHYLLQRFENTINNRNFRGPLNSDDKGLVIADNTDALKLREISRKMRRYNPTPNNSQFYNTGNRNLPLKYLIEDPVHRDSRDSFFLQMCDVVAYITYQKYQSNKRAKSKGLNNYYNNLDNVIVKKITNKNDYGILEE